MICSTYWVLGRYHWRIKWISVIDKTIFYRAKSNKNFTFWQAQHHSQRFIWAILSQFAILASKFKYFGTFPKLSSTFPAKMELSIQMRLLFFIFFQKLRLQFECDFKLSATTIFYFIFWLGKTRESLNIFRQNCYFLWFIWAILS